MLFSLFTKVSTETFFLLVLAILMVTASAMPAAAEYPATTLGTLLDRAQIEDTLVDYYSKLGTGGGDFSAFYVEDAVLDVNGLVAQGKKQIEDLYKRAAEESPMRKGTFRMLLTNIKIVVDGASATADDIWTGINSETVKAAPQFVEQGREHDELVKRDGRWYFKRRVITSDGGLTGIFEKNYKPR
jgi:ketosteroid isomerase-like protein